MYNYSLIIFNNINTKRILRVAIFSKLSEFIVFLTSNFNTYKAKFSNGTGQYANIFKESIELLTCQYTEKYFDIQVNFVTTVAP